MDQPKDTENDTLITPSDGKKKSPKDGESPNTPPSSPSDTTSSSDSESTEKIPLPPDGGWGWVIVVCCFLCNGMVDGMCSTLGVFQPHFVEYFQATRAETAMVVSLMSGFFMMIGPVSSALVNVLGCRVVTVCGGIVTTLALILSTLSTSVDMLIVTCGFIGGIGLGLIYLPAMVMVGYYFERRRALATGIACSGAGIGILIMAAVASALLYHFDWKNAMMIMAGFPLQCVLLGGLMRPIDLFSSQKQSDDSEANLVHNTSNEKQQQLLQSEVNRDMEEHKKVLPPHLFGSHDMNLKAESWDSQKGLNKYPNESVNTRNGFLKERILEQDVTSSCHEIPIKIQQHPRIIAPSMPNPDHDIKTKSCHNLSHHAKADPEFTKHHHHHRHRHHQHHHHHHHHRRDLGKPMLRKDIFYSGSIYNLPEYKNSPSMQSYLASITKLPNDVDSVSEDSQSKTLCRSCISDSAAETLKEMLDLSICTNPYFLILAAGSLFIQLAYYVPIMFIGEYAMSLGITPMKAASLISVMGIGNTLGRALSGALASIPGVPALHLNNLTLVMAGVATLLVTLLCKDYTSLVVYAAVYGLGLGAFIPLGVIFLVKYLGLHRLTNAFGLMSLVRGLASMAGPPIAGGLLDATGNYKVAFSFAGIMLVIAGLVHYLLPLVHRCSRRREVPSFATVVVEVQTDNSKDGKADGDLIS